MKTAKRLSLGSQNISRRQMAIFFVTILITAANACYAATNQVSIGISDILHHVEQATSPGQSYTATVHQIVTKKSAAGPTAMLVAGQPTVTNEEDFEVVCTSSGVVRPMKGLSTQQQSHASVMSSAQSTGGSAGGGVGGGAVGGARISPQAVNSSASASTNEVRLVMTVNPINTLRHIEQTHSDTIADVVYKNTACYKISSSHGRFNFDLWVNKTNWSVCRETITMRTNVLLDTQFEYENWNGVLVPSRVSISRPDNGTSVEQDYLAFQNSLTK